MGRRGHICAGYLVAALVFLILAQGAEAQSPTESILLAQGYQQGVEEDAATLRFVELYLRVAGGVWIVVEWTAAIFLILGYHKLARWSKVRGDA